MLRRGQQKPHRQPDWTQVLTRDLDEGICVVDSQGLIVSLNPAAERILGRREADAHGRRLQDIVSVSTTDGEPSLWHPVPREKTLRAEELLLRRHDGTTITVACTTAPIKHLGAVTGCVLTLKDLGPARQLEAHRSGEAYHRTLLDATPGSVIVTDLYGYITMANAEAVRLHGYGSESEMLGIRVLHLFAEDSRHRYLASKEAALRLDTTDRAEHTSLKKDGTTFPSEVGVSVMSRDGAPTAIITLVLDVTRHKHAEDMLRVTRERAAVEQAVAAVLGQAVTVGEAVPQLLRAMGEHGEWDVALFWRLDEGANVLRCDNLWHVASEPARQFCAAATRYSFAPGSGLPGRAWATTHPVWSSDLTSDATFLRGLAARKAGMHTGFCFPVASAGRLHAVLEFFSFEAREQDEELMRTTAAISGPMSQFLKRKDAERALEYRVRHDALTDLPNRFLFGERLERALAVASGSEKNVAVLLLDLDRFKEVNDTFGHHQGDLLLKEVALRLDGSSRSSDTVARLGGDEFAILLPSTDEAGALLAATRVLRSLERPFAIAEQALDVGAAIGIAVYPEHSADASSLVQYADVAMYAAKRAGTGYAVYKPEEDEHSPGRFALSVDLRHAIDRDQLLLHYQPKVNLTTQRVEGVEALVRWNHPERGFLAPNEFIPLAEQMRFIKPLTMWVLSEALQQCRIWREAGIPLRVAVNLSAHNLHDERLVHTIAKLLEAKGMEPDWLALEITESAIMVESRRVQDALAHLHRMGVTISIDDFGTGYSSLAHLRRLPVDEIKIDKSFVMDMLANEDDVSIARSVIDLGHNLGLTVVAEGVEGEGTYGMLQTMRCDQAQGFHLSRPMPASELPDWLGSWTEHETGLVIPGASKRIEFPGA